MELKERIRALRYQMAQKRKSKQFSTADFGKVFGVSKFTVESWENGRRRPNKSALIMLERRGLNKI